MDTNQVVGKLRQMVQLNHTHRFESDEAELNLRANDAWVAGAQLAEAGYAPAVDLPEVPSTIPAVAEAERAAHIRLAALAAAARREPTGPQRSYAWRVYFQSRQALVERGALEATRIDFSKSQLVAWRKLGIIPFASRARAMAHAQAAGGDHAICYQKGWWWTWSLQSTAGAPDPGTVKFTVRSSKPYAHPFRGQGRPGQLHKDGKRGHVARTTADITPREEPWGKGWRIKGAVDLNGSLWTVAAHRHGRRDDPTAWSEMLVRAASPEAAEDIFRTRVGDDPDDPRWVVADVTQSACDWENDAVSLSIEGAPVLYEDEAGTVQLAGADEDTE